MRLIKYKGKVRVTEQLDSKGRKSGATVEHKDGRVDAVAKPPTIEHKFGMDR
jgi:hypothetical protein